MNASSSSKTKAMQLSLATSCSFVSCHFRVNGLHEKSLSQAFHETAHKLLSPVEAESPSGACMNMQSATVQRPTNYFSKLARNFGGRDEAMRRQFSQWAESLRQGAQSELWAIGSVPRTAARYQQLATVLLEVPKDASEDFPHIQARLMALTENRLHWIQLQRLPSLAPVSFEEAGTTLGTWLQAHPHEAYEPLQALFRPYLHLSGLEQHTAPALGRGKIRL